MDRFEAGLVLTGTEVKAAKSGRIQLREATPPSIRTKPGWSTRTSASIRTATARIIRRCAAANCCCIAVRSINCLGKTREKGLSLIPTKIYLKGGRIKCELALARGKKLHDKRETERARTAETEAREAVRRSKARYQG